jgi:NAD(P)H-nitrite reductase large subunit
MDPEDIKKNWLRQNEKICVCRAIRQKIFVDLIKKGASTLGEINRLTGSGSGDCQGKRCSPRIKRLLAAYLPKNSKNSG